MGREIRRVPRNWEHPKDRKGNYIPLLDSSYSEIINEWYEEKEQWEKGLRKNHITGEWVEIEEDCKNMSYEEYMEEDKPKEEDYMPEWPGGIILN